jgi:peptidoglycan/LPS O-acetylase OafA/YrhL
VAVPAIVLTLLLDFTGRALLPALYGNYPFDQFAARVGASALMMNEVWLISITSFSNVPYWSICYEIWYYAAFGIAMFLPARWALPLLLCVSAILGPKILLLAPIWISGVLLHRWTLPKQISVTAASWLLIASIAGVVWFHATDVQGQATEFLRSLLGARLHEQLTFSKFFLSDYLLTVFVFSNCVAMRCLAEKVPAMWSAMERPVRFVAGYTFTLYLLHQPLFLFWGATLRGDPKGPGYWLMITALTFGSVLLIGHFTESRRHLLRQWLLRTLQGWDHRLRAAGPSAKRAG